MSTRETILAAFATQLAGVAGGRVYRSRREQIGTLPAVIVSPDSASGEEFVLGSTDHDLTVAVFILAKGDTPDSAADATVVAVHAAIMGATDLGLGSDVQVSQRFETEWDFEDYDYVRVILRYRVSYRTNSGGF